VHKTPPQEPTQFLRRKRKRSEAASYSHGQLAFTEVPSSNDSLDTDAQRQPEGDEGGLVKQELKRLRMEVKHMVDLRQENEKLKRDFSNLRSQYKERGDLLRRFLNLDTP
jgi:hypothetical protein